MQNNVNLGSDIGLYRLNKLLLIKKYHLRFSETNTMQEFAVNVMKSDLRDVEKSHFLQNFESVPENFGKNSAITPFAI